MSLPDFIPADAWAGYVEMRKKAKKPMTPRAETMQIKALEKFRDAGHNVAAILDQSTVNGWTDLYEPKGGGTSRSGGGIQALGKKGQATADNAKAWLDSDQSADAEKEAKKRFAALFAGLADYYKEEISKASLTIYWAGLKQYDYEAIEGAAWAHTQLPDESGHWMPRVDSLRRMLEGRTSDQGQIAWSKVDRAVRTVGPYADIAFDDPIVHRVMQDMGGWVHICNKDEKEWPFVAKEFVTRYQAYKMTGETPEHVPYLTGISSSQNQHSAQYQKLEVRLLGNVEKARAIASSGKAPAPQLSVVARQQIE